MSLQDNVTRVLSSLYPSIASRLASPSNPRPLVIGISGLQGSGKTTWATSVVNFLQAHDLKTIAVSLDDFYRTHDGLVALRDKNPENKLYRTRGQPGTHDEGLAHDFFASLRNASSDKPVQVPVFDKSKFNGEGDRAPHSEWPEVRSSIDVVVFEGWCVGFQPISQTDLERKLSEASKLEPSLTNTIPNHRLPHLEELNINLQRYCEAFMGPQHFEFFVHLDTNDLANVYRWRLQQEHKLIESKGTGMSDEQVEAFIMGYMPSYELYLEGLRKGIFDQNLKQQGRKHLRVLLGKEREVINVLEN